MSILTLQLVPAIPSETGSSVDSPQTWKALHWTLKINFLRSSPRWNSAPRTEGEVEKLLPFGHYLRQPAGQRETGRKRVGMGRSFHRLMQNVSMAGVTNQVSLQQEIGDQGNQVKSLGT